MIQVEHDPSHAPRLRPKPRNGPTLSLFCLMSSRTGTKALHPPYLPSVMKIREGVMSPHIHACPRPRYCRSALPIRGKRGDPAADSATGVADSPCRFDAKTTFGNRFGNRSGNR